jgi:lipoate-protein ligase A
VSLGNAQSPEQSLDLAELSRRGYDWVRRPTGGRAVLHADEITYCLVARHEGPFADGLAATHRRIARALQRFYRSLGLEAELSRPAGGRELDPRSPAPCFLAPGLAELELDGRKLAGSAQRRGRHAFLQHGSLPLGPAHLDLAELLPLPPEARRRMKASLSRQSLSLAEALESPPSRQELIEGLVDAFQAELGMSWL